MNGDTAALDNTFGKDLGAGSDGELEAAAAALPASVTLPAGAGKTHLLAATVRHLVAIAASLIGDEFALDTARGAWFALLFTPSWRYNKLACTGPHRPATHTPRSLVPGTGEVAEH